MSLTHTQEKVLDFLKAYLVQWGYPPSYREVQEGLGFANVCSVQYALDGLERRGYIKRKPHSPRAIQLIGYRVELHLE